MTDSNKPNIVCLMGFMGAGKSTLGQMLALRLGCDFMDLDAELEARIGCSIADIFAAEGEEGFRQRESELLVAVLSEVYSDGLVLALGGGTPCFGDNLALICSQSCSIYLAADSRLLVRRLLSQRAARPLIAGLDEQALEIFVRHRLAERQVYYTQAEHTIAFDNDQDAWVRLQAIFGL